MWPATAPGERRQRGQILPLTVLMLVVLIGVTGLAIDASGALFTQRFERAIADAASLAGAQDLQVAGSRNPPGPTQKLNARTHAMSILVAQLGASSTPSVTCTTESATGCSAGSSCLMAAGCTLPGTPYTVSIRTPSPSCVDCVVSPDLAVQVAITNPSFGLTFSRVLGPSQWAVRAASVAAIVHGRFYGVVSLRPPEPRSNCSNQCDKNEKDITLNGGSYVEVRGGDVGSNTTTYIPSNATMQLDAGFHLFHYDAYELWTPPPQGFQVSTFIKDPRYTIPVRVPQGSVSPPPTPIYDPSKGDGRDTDANCALEQAKVAGGYTMGDHVTPVNTLPITKVQCYKPGIYTKTLSNKDKSTAFLLEPGVYFMDGGLETSSVVIGGYWGGNPGVALVFNECANQCQLTANSADLLALNFGDSSPFGSGSRATAAVGPQGLVQTSTADPVLMTLLVVPDNNCQVVQPYPVACNDNGNNTLKLPGGGAVFVAGVQYAPSDNVKTAGNTNGQGIVGEIIAWTIYFDSGTLNLEAASSNDTGPLRLDSACSPGITVCNP